MFAIETLLGALIGYFTNDIAIRQLFAKNGVVVRERAQFTEMIVQVLKEQIIDEETVQTLSENPEVAMLFGRALRAFISEELPFALSDCALADIDDEGDLYEVMAAHVEALDLSGVALDSEVVDERLAVLAKDDVFRQSLAEGLEKLAQLSPDDIGIGPWLMTKLALFGAMDAPALAAWLDGCEQHVRAQITALWQKEATSLSLQDVLGMNGTALAQLGAELLLSGQKAQHTRWLDLLKDPSLQEHFYVLAERVLNEVLGRELPALISAFASFLQENRTAIEQMLLDSVAECGESAMFCDIASGILQKKFAEKKNGEDWLSALLSQLSQEEKRNVLCEKLTQFLLSWVVQAIDRWRQLAVDDEENVEALRTQLARLRPLVVAFLDAVLALPLGRLVPEKAAQALCGMAFRALRAHLTPEKLGAWLNAQLVPILSQPLSEGLLTPARQEKIVQALLERLAAGGVMEKTGGRHDAALVKKGLYAAIEGIYTIPMARLCCQIGQLLPYKDIAGSLQKSAFSKLRPFLGELTREHLDALSHAEIRELVLDMLGREMRPLAYLGGGIGAAAGAATGVAMEMSGVTPDPDQLAMLMAARTGLYGVVGYGTNVAAVHGLFRPYKRTLGMQGLMCKKQARFAEKMKELAASYIINESIWNEQVARLAQTLDAEFDTLLEDGARSLRESHQKNILTALKSWGKAQVGRWLYGAMDKRRLAQTLSQALPQAALHEVCARAFAAHHPYKQAVSRLAMHGAKSGRLSALALKKLQSVDAETWCDRGNKLLGLGTFPATRDYYEKLWQWALPYYKKVPELLLSQKAELVAMADAAITKQLSFTTLLGYRMAGGKRFVGAVLQVLLERKLPPFLFAQEENVARTAIDWLAGALAGKNALALGVSVSVDEGAWLEELAQRLDVTQLQQGLLTLFKHMQAVPDALETRLIDALLGQAMTLIHNQTLQEAWAAVNWQRLLAPLAPAGHAASDILLKDVSLDALFSLPEGRLEKLLAEALVLHEGEAEKVLHTLRTLWQIVSPPALATLSREGRTLLLLVDVPGLVEERINGLSPELLEALIRGIAQPYFTRVERMGWLGAVVAVPATVLSRLLGGY